jgi:alpha,alpha-trehalase
LGPKSYALPTLDSGGFRKYELSGNYQISNLLQELQLARDHSRTHIILSESRLSENPVQRLNRLIKYHFWDELTRRIDVVGLEKICADSKVSNQMNRIYVPTRDSFALNYYNDVASTCPHLRLEVCVLPDVVTPQFVQSLNEKPGILSLALRLNINGDVETIRGAPFVVPGGRFNEMYGWDSYFEALGLIQDDRVELARGMVDNFIYELEYYGKILNANRSYYLNRSQPPFLTDMITRTYCKLASNPNANIEDIHEWVRVGIRASTKELLSVWLSKPRLDRIGLSKYHPNGKGIPPETEKGHFDHIISPFAHAKGLSVNDYVDKYNNGHIQEPLLDEFFLHDASLRESGHDTSYRLEGNSANLATIDLNSLLYKYENDLAYLIGKFYNSQLALTVSRGLNDENLCCFVKWSDLVNSTNPSKWLVQGWDINWASAIKLYTDNMETIDLGADYCAHKIINAHCFTVFLSGSIFEELAKSTKHLVDEYLWDPKKQMYFDFDCAKMERTQYESATCIWALWSQISSPSQASLLVPVFLEKFEQTGGIVSGTLESRGPITLSRPQKQWDYPYGWAPHQILAWQGLANYGFHVDQERIAYRWLYTVIKVFFDYNGAVPEKFDVVNVTHQCNVEYGNVGQHFMFVVREGFGWMNASIQVYIFKIDWSCIDRPKA